MSTCYRKILYVCELSEVHVHLKFQNTSYNQVLPPLSTLFFTTPSTSLLVWVLLTIMMGWRNNSIFLFWTFFLFFPPLFQKTGVVQIVWFLSCCVIMAWHLVLLFVCYRGVSEVVKATWWWVRQLWRRLWSKVNWLDWLDWWMECLQFIFSAEGILVVMNSY